MNTTESQIEGKERNMLDEQQWKSEQYRSMELRLQQKYKIPLLYIKVAMYVLY